MHNWPPFFTSVSPRSGPVRVALTPRPAADASRIRLRLLPKLLYGRNSSYHGVDSTESFGSPWSRHPPVPPLLTINNRLEITQAEIEDGIAKDIWGGDAMGRSSKFQTLART
jgi:hypothetical protein